MTDECRPAEDAENYSLHWLHHPETDTYTIGEWHHSDHRPYWVKDDDLFYPEQMAASGRVYVRPARPDDAIRRADLELENARLRVVADAAREVATNVNRWKLSCTIPDENRSSAETLGAALKLARCLAAITPGDAADV